MLQVFPTSCLTAAIASQEAETPEKPRSLLKERDGRSEEVQGTLEGWWAEGTRSGDGRMSLRLGFVSTGPRNTRGLGTRSSFPLLFCWQPLKAQDSILCVDDPNLYLSSS